MDAAERALSVHLLDAPAEVRWDRVRQRNEREGTTFKMAVSREIFELANGAWEAPDERELKERPVSLVSAS